jgi:hypothetical protein
LTANAFRVSYLRDAFGRKAVASGVAGTYVAAASPLASVWNVNPVGSKYTAGLPAGVARHLQEVAWETTRRHHGRP